MSWPALHEKYLNHIKELMTEKLFPRKGAKAQRNPLETRQRFAPLRLCAKNSSAYRTFRTMRPVLALALVTLVCSCSAPSRANEPIAKSRRKEIESAPSPRKSFDFVGPSVSVH
jgi:hypothetical protein